MTREERDEIIAACRMKGTPSQVAEGQVHLLLADVQRVLDVLVERQERSARERIFREMERRRHG